MRNRCCWPEIYSPSDDGDSNGGNDTEGEDVHAKSEPSEVEDEEIELWEEEAIKSPRTELSAMAEDDSDLEEDYYVRLCAATSGVRTHLLTGSRTNRSSRHHAHCRRE